MRHRPSNENQMSFDWEETIDKRDLEGLIAEVAEECSLEAAQFLVERFGGMTLYVPKIPSRLSSPDEVEKIHLGGWMREVATRHSIGLARALVRIRGGEMAYIPVLSKLLDAVKARKIRRCYDGTNAGDLAVEMKLPRRKVLRLALSKQFDHVAERHKEAS